MTYSVEGIFLIVGQFDEVVNVSFKRNSESHQLYGDNITGEFIYTPNERERLQEIIDKELFDRNDGYVKFNELLKDLSQEKKLLLKTHGFKASDISSIIGSKGNFVNKFSDNKTRILPKPIEIKVDCSKIDREAWLINKYSGMISSGYKLIPDELNKYHAALLYKKGNNISDDEYNQTFVDNVPGKIKKGIYYHFLKMKFHSKEELSNEEQDEYKKLIDDNLKERVTILAKELKKSTGNIKNIYTIYLQNENKFSTMIATFEVGRLLMGRFPVWWNFERFVHIYLRHTQEFQVGERFIKKTRFQYSLKDVEILIEFVLTQVSKEIEEHFLQKPEKDFKRQGLMSIYYNGDFYVIHIAKDGRLMTFYKTVPLPRLA